MMNNLKKCNCLLIMTLMMSGQTLFAQDGILESGVTEQAKQQDVETQHKSDSEISNTDADDQVFIPTEEISEDAPVAFPVDI